MIVAVPMLGMSGKCCVSADLQQKAAIASRGWLQQVSSTFWIGTVALLPPNVVARAAAGAAQPHPAPLAVLPAAPEARPDALGTPPRLTGVAAVAVLHCCWAEGGETRPPLLGNFPGWAGWLPARLPAPHASRCFPPRDHASRLSDARPVSVALLSRPLAWQYTRPQTAPGLCRLHHHGHFTGASLQAPSPKTCRLPCSTQPGCAHLLCEASVMRGSRDAPSPHRCRCDSPFCSTDASTLGLQACQQQASRPHRLQLNLTGL